jgi:formate-dependent nitrite reductase membrane component NrfD
VNRTEVTREGLSGARPDREADLWTSGSRPEAAADPGTRGRGDARRGPADAPAGERAAASYYGEPIINPPVWEEREIAGYLFTGGLAGGSSLVSAAALLSGRPRLAQRSGVCASAAISVSLAALIKDLGRPERFINMLRVVKPTSPMNMGTWILSAYTPLALTSAASVTTGRAPRLGRTAAVGAGALGPLVATYTAALIADTAVPVWHEGRRELPFLFAGSAASAAAGFALAASPRSESEPARLLAVAGAAVELIAEGLLERRLGALALAEPMHTGVAGSRLIRAKLLTVAGLGAAATVGRGRAGAVASGGALLAGSALTRFGLFAAGMTSAKDPRFTVDPQRARLGR